MTTWDDPRTRYRQIHGTPSNVPSMPGEHIPLQVNYVELSNVFKKSLCCLSTCLSVNNLCYKYKITKLSPC